MDQHIHNEPGARLPAGHFPGAGRAQFGQGSASALSMKWSALHEAAEAVAAIAGREAAPLSAQQRNFPIDIREAGESVHRLVEEGVEDISALMEPGLAALLAVNARGNDPSAAAAALWEEFVRARDALLTLVPEKPVAAALRIG